MCRDFEFFFDFMSPPTYLAYRRLPGLIERTGAQVRMRPMLTLGLHQLTGNRSPRETPNKAAWMARDLQLQARRYGVVLNANSHMDVLKIVPPLRGALVAEELGQMPAYCEAMFRGMWQDDVNIGDADEWSRLISRAGLDPVAFKEGVDRPDIKERLRANTQEAADRGAFGAPSFFVGDVLYWGQDRLDFVEEALAG